MLILSPHNSDHPNKNTNIYDAVFFGEKRGSVRPPRAMFISRISKGRMHGIFRKSNRIKVNHTLQSKAENIFD
jgi:hypothetical protein